MKTARRKTTGPDAERGVRSPCLTDSKEQQADWLELCALRDSDHNASFSDLVAEFDVSGSEDAELSEEDDGSGDEGDAADDNGAVAVHRYEAAADAAFLELSERWTACGGDGGWYPFEMGDRHIGLNAATENSVYVFLLLLSNFGHAAGPTRNDGAKLFEDVCAEAARNYLGGTQACSRVFGFPRRLGPKGFANALSDLCAAMGEGVAAKKCPKLSNQKDAGLDVVAWRGFPDARRGMLISFGQCATGRNWHEKLSELQPQNWCRCWMAEAPSVTPARFFFVPHRVEEIDWAFSCCNGGVLFERCRIAHLAPSLPESLAAAIAAWSGYVLANCLRS